MRVGGLGCVWGSSGAPGFVWELLGTSKCVCEHLGTSGNVSERLGVHVWERLGKSGNVWERLDAIGSVESVWEVKTSGAVGLGASERMWARGRSGNVWERYAWERLGAFGSACERLEASGNVWGCLGAFEAHG